MNVTFYFSAVVAVVTTALAITRRNAVHALIYLVVSLFAVAAVFYTLGAPFIAALEVIIYAGAIMVLFVFVIMMLGLGPQSGEEERRLLGPEAWIGPGIISLLLIALLIFVLVTAGGGPATAGPVEPKQVGLTLFGPYLLGVELASMLLLAGAMGAAYLGQRSRK